MKYISNNSRSLPLFLCLISILLTSPCSAKYSGGTGETLFPYLINDPCQLNQIGLDSSDWDKHFKLINDLDLSHLRGTEYNIIGSYPDTPFTGTFDGNGHTITNFNYSSSAGNNIGLFGYVGDPCAVISDLGLIDPCIAVTEGNSTHIGTLVAYFEEGAIRDCAVKSGKIFAPQGTNIGGLVGYCSYGSYIYTSYANCSIIGNSNVGGLVGFNFLSEITSSYASGMVSGNNSVGGLLGYNTHGFISSCYSTNSVQGNTSVGGLVGYSESGSEITSSFWDIQTSGTTSSAGGTGLPTTQMQDPCTFLEVGWDFVGESANGIDETWDICAGTNYPKLSWAIPSGDLLCPDGVDAVDLALLVNQWLRGCSACASADNNADERVDLDDLSIIFSMWLEKNCGYCNGADLSGDGDVNMTDMAILSQYWLLTGCYDCLGTDINLDNIVDIGDFAIMAGNWLNQP